MRMKPAARLARGRQVAAVALVCCLLAGCATFRPQRYASFETPTPIPAGNDLILGFMGARESWDASKRPVRGLALQLRAMHLPGVHVETIENTRRDLALDFVRKALDTNHDGILDAQERAEARIILYGHSFGGAAVVKFARQLKQLGIPVLLAIEVDSVGRGDDHIPSNVARAANFYQSDGLIIHGCSSIHAEDPSSTEILGSVRYDSSGKHVDTSNYPLLSRAFASAHVKMASDPEVWQQVENLILQEIRQHRGKTVASGR